MEAKRRYRKKPLAVFEHGTRVYAPAPGVPVYRVVTTDATGRRVFMKVHTEADARAKARELEAYLSSVTPVRAFDQPLTVAALAARYHDHIQSRSARYRERQAGLLGKWVLPALGDTLVSEWTPAASERVLADARAHVAPATIQGLGSCMRSLVTFAHKSRWLPRDVDPMWLVSYSANGDRLALCRQVMGRRRGEPLVRVADVMITSVTREPLRDITADDVALEGFAPMTPPEFIDFFCRTHKGCTPETTVTRIEWRYLDDDSATTIH